MYIKEITLDGFKSYMQKTTVGVFDEQFNAITGLNGSGKSNILDGIMFVLGLQQYSMARVSKLQEFIYKNGQAGITKAQVTIVFDNSDKEKSPVGYQDCNQIIVARQIQDDKSKYFINGLMESNKKVKDVFRSIQLNIDNPHFLVAQGKITKVVNLKGQDLVRMLEETAGTSLFMEKKRECQRLIKKKEEKIMQVKKLIDGEIEPRFEKMIQERKMQQEYQEIGDRMKSLERQMTVYRYNEAINQIMESKRKLELYDQDQKSDEYKLRKLEGLQKQEKEQMEIKEKAVMMDDAFKMLELRLRDKKRQVGILETEITNDVNQYNQCCKNRQNVQNDLENIINNIPIIGNRVEQMKQSRMGMEQQLEELDQKVEESRKALAGKSKGEQFDNSKLLYQSKQQYQQNQCKRDRMTKDVIEINQQIQEINESQQQQGEKRHGLQNEQKKILKRIEELQDKQKGQDYNQEEYIYQNNQKKQRVKEFQEKQKQIYDMQGQFWQFRLDFRLPYDGFDRSKVAGRLLGLFQVKEQKFIQAIEQAAGNRLNFIVVDDEQTAKILLKKDCFGQQVQMIPLNKVQDMLMDRRVMEKNSELAKKWRGDSVLAIDVISYDRKYERAMRYVFGNVLIVSNGQVGQAISQQNDRYLRRKCVNLEGDIYDPSGTMSGGYSNQSRSVLANYQKKVEIENEMANIKQLIKENEERLREMDEVENRNSSIINMIKSEQMKYDEIQVMLQKGGHNNEHDKQRLQNQKVELEEQISQMNRKQMKLEAEIQEYEQMDHKMDKKQVIKQCLDRFLKDKDELRKEIQQLQQNMGKYVGEIESGEENKQRLHTKKLEFENEEQKLKLQKENKNKQLDQQKIEMVEIDKEYKQMYQRQLEQQSELQQMRENIKAREVHKQELEKKLEDYDLKVQHESRKLKVAQDDQQQLCTQYHKYNQMEIEDEESINAANYEEKEDELIRLKNKIEHLRKNINFKSDTANSHLEDNYLANKEKYQKLCESKLKLGQELEELDVKRKTTLQDCYKNVNKTMNEIFSILLKGCQCKLKEVEEGNVEEGLEIGVQFGKKWVSGLSELSGGQRSLLALSFILSLLKYRPAPFYILDEIDAALDTSHTENIGLMIQQQFPFSQFIIISLKEGMFNHANVLFRTSFNHGISKVDRISLKNKKKKELNNS